MSSPVSSSPTLGTIEGDCYDTHVYGIGAEGYDRRSIYIKSRRLSVSEDGSVFKTDIPFSSNKAETVSKEYLSECNSNKRPYDETEYQELMKKTEQEAKKKVKVPLEVVDEIDTLMEEKELLEARMAEINKTIKGLAQRLF